MKLRRTLRYWWLKLRRLQGDPRKLALGMALGIFIGFTPTIPFHTVMALALAPLLRVSVVTAVMGVWLCNPLLQPPLYLASYAVGRRLLFRGDTLKLPETWDLSSVLDLLWRGGLALQVGGVLIAIPPAVAAYFITLWIIRNYRGQRLRRVQGVRRRLSQEHS
ncbi:MAG: DUF2062 domain-containing protein [Deltaproteobacteria bacterium]|nr:DUF2062 domain-containing protein [Deltaproteobacteria bacterium]